MSTLFLVILTSMASNEWRAKMTHMGHSITELIPLTTRKGEFSNPKNRKKILKHLKTLDKRAHDLRPAQLKQEKDPSVAFIAQMLEEEAQSAHREFRVGRPNRARHITRSLVSYCIGCHTRATISGTPKLALSTDKLRRLDPFTRADVLLATRRFDRALKEYEALLRSPAVARKAEFDWLKSVQRALMIAIRVKQDPQLAQNLTNAALTLPGAPVYAKFLVAQWKDSVVIWKEDRKEKLTSAKAYLERARRLLATNASMGSLIEYLRATGLMHQFMRAFPKHPRMAEAFQLAGRAYEGLADLEMWNLHELYYTACILSKPGSGIAQGCYRFMELAVARSYMTENVAGVPESEAKRLRELKKVAF